MSHLWLEAGGLVNINFTVETALGCVMPWCILAWRQLPQPLQETRVTVGGGHGRGQQDQMGSWSHSRWRHGRGQQDQVGCGSGGHIWAMQSSAAEGSLNFS